MADGDNMPRARFHSMCDGTKEDWDRIYQAMKPFIVELPDRVLAHLGMLRGDCGGFAIDPQFTTAFVRGEVRAAYGGIFTVMGIYTVLAAMDPATNRGRILFIGLLWIGACLGRAWGAVIARSARTAFSARASWKKPTSALTKRTTPMAIASPASPTATDTTHAPTRSHVIKPENCLASSFSRDVGSSCASSFGPAAAPDESRESISAVPNPASARTSRVCSPSAGAGA